MRRDRLIHRRPAAIFLLIIILASLTLSACGETPSAQPQTPAPSAEMTTVPSQESTPTPTAEPTPAPTDEPQYGIFLTGGEETELICGLRYTEPGFTALDTQGRDMSERVTVEGEVCCWQKGEYELSYAFTDDEGREFSAQRRVKVVPAYLPETAVQERVIYLSFDDGPCENTPEALAVLREFNAKATFFVVTAENKHIDMLSDIAADGHTIGIHASYHRYGQIYSSRKNYFTDLINARETVFEKTGQYPTVVRFPGGGTTAWAYSDKNEGGVRAIFDILHDMGMREYDWNVQPENHEHNITDMYYTFIDTVPKRETPVVLQHDTRLYSIHALRRMLEWGTENGYTFKGLDCTVPEVHQRIKEKQED